jgi:hypothetical protein
MPWFGETKMQIFGNPVFLQMKGKQRNTAQFKIRPYGLRRCKSNPLPKPSLFQAPFNEIITICTKIGFQGCLSEVAGVAKPLLGIN